MESTTFELTVLNPSLLDQRIGEDGNFVVEQKIPTIIDTRAIVSIQPTSEEHLNNICDLWYKEKLKNQEKNRRIII